MEEKTILEYYEKCKNAYKTARDLNLNQSYVSTLVSRYHPNTVPLDEELELKIIETISLFPYTGTKAKIAKYLGITGHSLNQILLKTQNSKLKEFFSLPKCSTKLSDQDIKDILECSKRGIGNDLMGLMKGADGTTIRTIRKRFLPAEEYSKYHSIERFYSGDYNAYYNVRGDKLLSTWEEKVADLLYKNKIEYHTNVRLSYKGKNYSPDFFLPKNRTFIELFGMSNISLYKQNMEKKIEYYNSNNIKCLFLFEEDFLKDKKFINLYEEKVLNFVYSLKDVIFNQHIENIYTKI
jgi:hypothetical protein